MSSDRSDGGHLAPHGEAAIALGFAVFDFGDRDRQQLPLAQQLPHVFDGVAFDDAVLFAARGVESGVFEGAHGERLVLARDAQDFFDRGFAAQDLVEAVVADGGRHRARITLELVLGGFVVDHGAHRVVDDDEFIDAGAAAEAAGSRARPVDASATDRRARGPAAGARIRRPRRPAWFPG